MLYEVHFNVTLLSLAYQNTWPKSMWGEKRSILWRYLLNDNGSEHYGFRDSSRSRRPSRLLHLSSAALLLSTKSADEESSLPTFTFVIPVRHNDQHAFLQPSESTLRKLRHRRETAKSAYPECSSLAAAARWSRWVRAFQTASRRGRGSRWSAASPWRSCCGTWAAGSETHSHELDIPKRGERLVNYFCGILM